MYLSSILVALHALSSTSLIVKPPPQKAAALVEKQQAQEGVKLIPSVAKRQWAEQMHRVRMHMLNSPRKTEKKQKEDTKKSKAGCLACEAKQIVYGKYHNIEGEKTDNSYFLFKDPSRKDPALSLPVIIQFHAGGFYSGAPWQQENDEIKGYLSAGFAVLSVGYRLTTEKYFYQAADGSNKTEELIHTSEDGKLSLDTTGKTMEDYEVRVGRQEFMTKVLYDATQMMEHFIKNAGRLGLDVTRIVFVGESSGGAAMQYLSFVYHKWNEERYTPRGIIYTNAQLNYPSTNMLEETWNLFSEIMGPQVKLADVISQEACPTIVGNHMCNSALGNASDYNLCNEEWNERSLREFCGEALRSATLGQAAARQVWPEKDENTSGIEKLWYNSENMQQHMPSDPFYIYVANSLNGTGALDVSHHSIFALNFAKYAEMGQHGGHQYTVYYTDFAHMTEADRGLQRLEVLHEPSALAQEELPLLAAGPPVPASGPSAVPQGLAPAPAVAPAPAPAPAAGPAFAVASPIVFNYLSTHGWREDVAEARGIDAGSMKERVLYASLAAGIGPFGEIANRTENATESAAPHSSFLGVSVTLVTLIAFLSGSD